MLRVIAGSLGGRRLHTPRGDATRPTQDRVKEALFSILGDVSDLVVLDLYAGSGALAIEALSRGAARAVLVESAREAALSIERNLTSLSLGPRATLLRDRVERARLAPLGPFELVLADPPYASLQQATAVLDTLARGGVFAPHARLALEHAASDRPTLASFALVSTRVYGETAISLGELTTSG